MKKLILLATIFALSACDSSEGEGLDLLQKNQRKWEALNTTEYELTFTFSAFSYDTGEYRIYVDRDKVQTVLYKGYESNKVEEYKSDDHFAYESASVSGLFALAEKAISTADEYRIEYHPDFGYPTLIYVDYSKDIADDEASYGARDLVGVSPIACSMEAAAGINLTLLLPQHSTQEVCDATVYIEDGDYVEQLGCANGIFAGAWERTGTYDVTVNHNGTVTQVLTDVTVYPFLCHVGPRVLTVELIN